MHVSYNPKDLKRETLRARNVGRRVTYSSMMRLSGELEFEPFFDQPQFDLFKALVREEFGLPDDTLVESCDRARELIILLEDEIFC